MASRCTFGIRRASGMPASIPCYLEKRIADNRYIESQHIFVVQSKNAFPHMQMLQNVKPSVHWTAFMAMSKRKVIIFIYWMKPQYFSQPKLPEKSLFHMSS